MNKPGKGGPPAAGRLLVRCLLLVSTIAPIALISLSCVGFIMSRGENVTFPGDVKTVEVNTREWFLGGAVAATGEGEFIVTRSSTALVPEGTSWRVFGQDQRYWGSRLEFRGLGSPQTHAQGTIRCAVIVPPLGLEKRVTVTGYVSVQGIWAQPAGTQSDPARFENIRGRIESERISLSVFPAERKDAATTYSRLIGLLPWGGFTGLFAMLLWLGALTEDWL